MVLVMCKINYILYKYILKKYSSIPNFANIFGIPQQELSAMLLKENIADEIASGFKICKFLNLDIEKLIFKGEISESINGGNNSDSLKSEFQNLYMRLSATEKKNVIDYMISIRK